MQHRAEFGGTLPCRVMATSGKAVGWAGEQNPVRLL